MLQTENFFCFFDRNVSSLNGGTEAAGGDAGDDDFGDFKFVPAASSLNHHHHPPPPPTSSSSSSDDEWGNFVDCFPSDSFSTASPLPTPPFLGRSFGHPLDQSSRDPKPSLSLAGVSSRPLPLSIFGENEQEQSEEGCLPVLDRSGLGNGFFPSHVSKDNPVLAFSDLIANLYSEAEQIKQVAAEADLPRRISDDEGDSDDKDWEFQDAFSDNRLDAYDANSGQNGDQINAGSAISWDRDEESNFSDLFLLYSRLKEVARKYTLQHLDALESERKVAFLSGDEAKSKVLNLEIQSGYAKLHEEEEFSSNGLFGDHPLKNTDDVELFKAINEPKFEDLEQEYCLLDKISAAKDSLSSALVLFEHTIAVLSIMTLATVKEQFAYLSAWSKIISACCKELQHGALIWRRALEDQVDKAILDDTQGMGYFLSLGEVYRISEVLKITCELYRPWLLLNKEICRDITILLKECSSEWNDCGLKEALTRISSPRFPEKEKKKLLLESIESIHNVDIVSVQNSVFGLPHHLCHLSLLPLNCLHGVESVSWGGRQFFLTLANLWANLISTECPQLPHVHVRK